MFWFKAKVTFKNYYVYVSFGQPGHPQHDVLHVTATNPKDARNQVLGIAAYTIDKVVEAKS